MSGSTGNAPATGRADQGSAQDMDGVAGRVREQLTYDLEALRRKRDRMVQYRPPVWRSLRFLGLVVVFVAGVAWYTQTETGLTIGMVLFIVGALLIMVPRGMGFSSILRWDGGLKISNPQLELRNLDEQIASIERVLDKMAAEQADEPRP
jgi:hypothetical protein